MPNPIAVDIFFETAMKVHMPRKNDKAKFDWDMVLSMYHNSKITNKQMVYILQELGYDDKDNEEKEEEKTHILLQLLKSDNYKTKNTLVSRYMHCLKELNNDWCQTIKSFNHETNLQDMKYELLRLFFKDD